jgi:hypothetical protein
MAIVLSKSAPVVNRYRPVVITHRRNISSQRVVRVRSSFDIVEDSRILGEGIIAGVFFYTSLQWVHYRRMRMEAEKRMQENEDKKKKKDDEK